MIVVSNQTSSRKKQKQKLNSVKRNTPALLAVPNVPLAEEVAVEVLNTGDALILQKAVTEGSHLS